MLLTIWFACLECNRKNELVWDTAGFMAARGRTNLVHLICQGCGHISGEL